MTKTPSLALALFDFVPVILFALGGWYLARAARMIGRERWPHLILLGTLLVTTGGGTKAVAKLASAGGLQELAGIGDLHFVLQAPGFILMTIAVAALVRLPRALVALPSPLAVMLPWKVPLVILMALSGMIMHGLLASIAWRRNLRPGAVCFGTALIFLLAMGAAAGGDQTIVRQWMEESINSVGQFSFMLGSLLLYRDVATHSALTARRQGIRDLD